MAILLIMQISDEDLEEFMRLYTAEFGERLSKEEASEVAGRFVDLYTLLAEPLPSEQEGAAEPFAEDPAPLTRS